MTSYLGMQVLAALMECGDAQVAKAAKSELTKLMKKPETLAKWLAPFKATV